MKKGIHPDYHEITIIMTDGEERTIRSTYGKPGDKLRLDEDCKSHGAWTGQAKSIEKGNEVERFRKRYGDLGNLGI